MKPSQGNYDFTWGDEFLADPDRWNWIKNKSFLTICVIAHMLERLHQGQWATRIFEHLQNLPQLQQFEIDMNRLGGLHDWEGYCHRHWFKPAHNVSSAPVTGTMDIKIENAPQ